jgi:hypothetical protein
VLNDVVSLASKRASSNYCGAVLAYSGSPDLVFKPLVHETDAISLRAIDKYHPQLVRFVFVAHEWLEYQINVLRL